MENNNKNTHDYKTEIHNINEKLDRHITFEQTRMDRIEDKIDKITEVIISLAKVEEKITHIVDNSKELRKEVDTSKNIINDLNFRVFKNTNELESIKRFKWIILTSISTSVFAALTTIIINTKFI